MFKSLALVFTIAFSLLLVLNLDRGDRLDWDVLEKEERLLIDEETVRIKSKYTPTGFKEIKDADYSIIMIDLNQTTDRARFDRRQLCSIESVALNNPRQTLIVYSLSPPRELLGVQFRQRYPNVLVKPLDLDDIFSLHKDYEWWMEKDERVRSYIKANLASVLKYMILRLVSAIYLNIDTVYQFDFEVISDQCIFLTQNSTNSDKTNLDDDYLLFSYCDPLAKPIVFKLMMDFESEIERLSKQRVEQAVKHVLEEKCQMKKIVTNRAFYNSMCSIQFYPREYFIRTVKHTRSDLNGMRLFGNQSQAEKQQKDEDTEILAQNCPLTFSSIK